jgi:hypothetical protein
MLARRLTTILPTMTLAEAIETTRIHRVAGLTGGPTSFVTTRPCRAPHHTILDVGLIGGGPVPRPGEVSRAHHGMRFLDGLPECRRPVLEVLCQPLEDNFTRMPSRDCPRPHRSRCTGSMDERAERPALARIVPHDEGCAPGCVPHLGRPRHPASEPMPNLPPTRSASHGCA